MIILTLPVKVYNLLLSNQYLQWLFPMLFEIMFPVSHASLKVVHNTSESCISKYILNTQSNGIFFTKIGFNHLSTEKQNLLFLITKDWKQSRLHVFWAVWTCTFGWRLFDIPAIYSLSFKKYNFCLLHSRHLIFGHGHHQC